jgi:transposase
MLGERRTEQYEFFAGSLRDLIPNDHVLVRVARVFDLTWLKDEVADVYCADNGRPSIAPEVAVRLMLAGFLLGIVHDRRLMREAAVNVAIRWFSGFGLTERLPDHSSLTRIRQRWGAERFRRIFERTVQACVAAGIARGEVVHLDASLIRADVSWEALASRWVEKVGTENEPANDAERDAKTTGKYKKVCTTDPDATMATTGRNQRLEPSYKQHTAVCDQAGVVVDVEITTGEVNEGGELVPAIARVEAITGSHVAIATADAGYAYAKVYGQLERRRTAAIIPPKAEPIRSPVPLRRFHYDARHDVLKCPRGRVLKAGRRVKHGRFFTSRAKDCRRCDLARLCLSGKRTNKAVVVGDDYPALLRARRQRQRWGKQEKTIYTRHRWRVEGIHGEAKTCHGLARAVRRGLGNMKIQAYLTAAAINLKRLAAFVAALLLLATIAQLIGTSRAPHRALA